jgi:hypothetical protein
MQFLPIHPDDERGPIAGSDGAIGTGLLRSDASKSDKFGCPSSISADLLPGLALVDTVVRMR